jgi:high-affinity iron transporter
MAQIIPGFIVGLREGLEAFLIVTLILEYLNKLGKKELHGSVTRGMFTGLGISVVFGILLWLLALTVASGSDAVGKLWEAGASLVAVLFITYFIYWMIQHGKSLVQDVRDSVDANLSARGLFLLATVAVAREGAEIALFAFTAEDKVIYLTGTISGILVAAILALLIYKSLVRVDIGLIFRITLVYLILQAGYLFGYAIHELLSALQSIGMLSADAAIYAKLYNLGGTVLDHKTGLIGIPLNVLVGWYSKPEIIQAIIQLVYIGILGNIWRRKNSTK